MSAIPTLLSTTTIVESGIIDILWNSGWREPDIKYFNFHGASKDDPIIQLPKIATVCCYVKDFSQVLEHLRDDGKYIIICRDGDQNLEPKLYKHIKNNVLHIFSINVLENHPKITPMPWVMYKECYGQGSLEKMFEIPREKKNKVLAAFSIEGYRNYPHHERLSCVKYFSDKSWVTMPDALRRREWVTSPMPSPDYLYNLRMHDYLAAPIGYGNDRMAYWEAMFLGTIPICLKHPSLLHFSDMPIAFVDNWENITPEWCDSNLHIINKSTEKLKLNYWLDRIKESKSINGM